MNLASLGSRLFSAGGSALIKNAGEAIDSVFTSKHELALTNVQLEEIKAETARVINQLSHDLDAAAINLEATMEHELTERLKADMASDSWLAKNVRPGGLAFVLVVVCSLASATIFKTLTGNQLAALQAWVPFFSTVLMTMIGFYYGGRTMEKRAVTLPKTPFAKKK